MTSEPSNEWVRYALISRLAKRLGDNRQFGKKAAQKVVYLLQELGRVPLGFRYTFYTYGVFSSELAYTLGVVQGLEGVNVDYDGTLNAYWIRPGEKAEMLERRSEDFLRTHENAIEEIVSFSMSRNAKNLELISTIAFVEKNEKSEISGDANMLVQRVNELKPQFSCQEIISGIKDLHDLSDSLGQSF